MNARATEIWRVSWPGPRIIGTDVEGNDIEIARVVHGEHARWIAKVPQLIAIMRRLNEQVHTSLTSDGRKGVRVPEAFGVEGVAELLAEIDGKWPGEDGGG